MLSNTKTPRTDVVAKMVPDTTVINGRFVYTGQSTELVSAEFARELELELNKAKEFNWKDLSIAELNILFNNIRSELTFRILGDQRTGIIVSICSAHRTPVPDCPRCNCEIGIKE